MAEDTIDDSNGTYTIKDGAHVLSDTGALKIAQADIRGADIDRSANAIRVDGWRKQYDGEPYGNEVKGKSNLVTRDTKRQDDWQHASLKEPFLARDDIIKCAPVTAEDGPLARQQEAVLNHQFTRTFDRYGFITDVVRLRFVEGTVVAKTSWVYEDKEVLETVPITVNTPVGPLVTGEEEVKRTVVLQNKPYVELCNIKDIYMDPTCRGDVSKAGFFGHRYESDFATLHATGRYRNLEAAVAAAGNSDADDYEENKSNFKFEDHARKKVLVYEYWGYLSVVKDGPLKPIVLTYIGDTVIFFGDNPTPGGVLPFHVYRNNPKPFSNYGEASCELIAANQQTTTAIMRGIVDNMANSNNAQKGVKEQTLDSNNLKRFLNNKNFVYRGERSDMFEGSYNNIPPSVFSVLGMIQNETDSQLGIKGFGGDGISGSSFGQSAAAANGVIDALSVRRTDHVRSISQGFLIPIFRAWTQYNNEFLDPEEVSRITNEEYIPTDPDDTSGSIDIQMTVSTAEDNEARSRKLSFILQTMAPSLPEEVARELMGEFFDLENSPKSAKIVREYQPKEDPSEEILKSLSIEKLKAEILERISRTEENETDKRLKAAKAQVEESRARSLNSQSDITDQEFLQNEDRNKVENLLEELLSNTSGKGA